MTSPLVVADPETMLAPGQLLFTTPEMYNPKRQWPTFTSQEVAKCFFGRSKSWLDKYLITNPRNSSPLFGKVEPLRGKGEIRRWRLWDIERLAHTFAYTGLISGAHLQQTVLVVKTVAKLTGHIG